MLTIFCSPKPFTGEADWNQRNALRSWKAIHPDVEIFIFGDAPGAEQAASEVNAIFVPEIETSPSGAPSFNAMQSYVSEHGRFDLQMYVNCDILLNVTVLKAMLASRNRFDRFLLVGERLDLMQGVTIDASVSDWLEILLPFSENGKLVAHGPTGVDYFGFVRGMWDGLAPVFMGRSLCDQALLHYCLNRQVPLVDATQAVTAIHQYHDYSHVRGGKQAVFQGDDWALMAREHQLGRSLPTITDAEWRFGDTGHIIKGRKRWLRDKELVLRYRYRLESFALIFRALQYLGGRKNLHPKSIPIGNILLSWRQFFSSN